MQVKITTLHALKLSKEVEMSQAIAKVTEE